MIIIVKLLRNFVGSSTFTCIYMLFFVCSSIFFLKEFSLRTNFPYFHRGFHLHFLTFFTDVTLVFQHHINNRVSFIIVPPSLVCLLTFFGFCKKEEENY